MRIKVALVDDDPLIVMALETILKADPELAICGKGCSGTDAIALCREKNPDVLVTDIRMKEMDGLTALKAILEENPAARVLLLTTFLDDEYIVRAIRLGAKGYLLKQNYSALAPAIKAIYSGQSVFGEEVTAKMPNLISGRAPAEFDDSDLTEREAEL